MQDPTENLKKLIKKAKLQLNPGAVLNEGQDSANEKLDELVEEEKKTVKVVGLDVLTLKGDKGEEGEKGEKGDPGLDGLDGLDGRDGKDGIDGRDGLDGKDGIDGRDGLPGEKGEKGDKGDKGDSGKDSTTDEVIEAIKKLPEKKKLDISHLRNSTQIQSAISKMIKGGGITGVNTNKITVSATSPSDPKTGDLWVDIS